jgi:hypothetical protein
VKVPNADRAVIAVEKIRDYLLNPAHRRGGSKARRLIAMGYSADDWQQLADDLRSQHLGRDVDAQEQNEYGEKYIIIADLLGPVGDSVPFRSVWQIDVGTDVPRLITMYPE